jgi:NAD(P)-dependent dehydrogenase (short-subunit alcohol dehydrogenase family)
VELVPLDLSDQNSIAAAAKQVETLTDKLYILVNNAGVCVTTRQSTAQGIEFQFGVNHIGPFLLTNLLLPLLLRAASSPDIPPGSVRVVNLTSAGHRLSPVRFSDYNLERSEVPEEEDHFKPLPGAFAKCTDDGYNPIVAYCQSKSANILFTVGLQKRLRGTGVGGFVLHPGSKSALPFPILRLHYVVCGGTTRKEF